MSSQNRIIRSAILPQDAERILEVFAAGKAIMVAVADGVSENSIRTNKSVIFTT